MHGQNVRRYGRKSWQGDRTKSEFLSPSNGRIIASVISIHRFNPGVAHIGVIILLEKDLNDEADSAWDTHKYGAGKNVMAWRQSQDPVEVSST